MKHLFTIILALTVLFQPSKCQENSQASNDSTNFWLSLRSISFVKNNEYYSPVTEGYTLIGSFIQPELVYSPSKKVRLQAGAHILSYSGAEKNPDPKFVLSASYYLSDKTWLTLGSLSGSDKHQLFDPNFDVERLYKSYHEEGLEFVTGNNHFFSNTWINWENFIFKGDTTREIFTAGESFRYNSKNEGDFFSVEIPVQIQFKHFGGQISNYSGHVTTYFNVTAGLRLNFEIAEGRFGTAGVEYDQFNFSELTKKGDIGIIHGYASWYRFHYNLKPVYFGSYYWKSHNYYAPEGNPIYSSISDYQNNVIVPGRSIWTNCLYLNLNPTGFMELFFGVDAYYDLHEKRMDTAMTLHLNFSKLIRLASLK